MIEVTKVTKRKDNRYLTIKLTPIKTLIDKPTNHLQIRVHRFENVDGSIGYNPRPSFGCIRLKGSTLEAGVEHVFKIKLTVPEDVIAYEIGVVREGVRWDYKKWLMK